MAVGPDLVARSAPVAVRPRLLHGVLEREGAFSWIMLAPGVLFLLAFVAYPLFYGVWLSLQATPVAHGGGFWQGARNSFVYTIVPTVLKLLGGFAMALVITQHFRGRSLVRASLLL